ncbi:hypothetical protein WMF34_11560 [Sorangium sp. So ce145]|nr:hypothetical protein [Sorangium cellulosum]
MDSLTLRAFIRLDRVLHARLLERVDQALFLLVRERGVLDRARHVHARADPRRQELRAVWIVGRQVAAVVRRRRDHAIVFNVTVARDICSSCVWRVDYSPPLALASTVVVLRLEQRSC